MDKSSKLYFVRTNEKNNNVQKHFRFNSSSRARMVLWLITRKELHYAMV